MKATLCCLVLVLVVGASGYPQRASKSIRDKRGFRSGAADRFSHGFGKRTQDEDDFRDKRGFRSGAADRFSHGFGKRNDAREDTFRDIVTVKDIANLIQSNEKAAIAFVRRYMDLNDDGYISPDELALDL